MTNYLYFKFYIYFYVANVSLALKFRTTISSFTLELQGRKLNFLYNNDKIWDLFE